MYLILSECSISLAGIFCETAPKFALILESNLKIASDSWDVSGCNQGCRVAVLNVTDSSKGGYGNNFFVKDS